jgi:heme-degrading monooxygenase HmoA
MFARVNEVTIKSDADQAVLQQATEDWRALIRQQPGYQGHVAVLVGERGMTVTTLWESKEAADGWLENPAFQKMRSEHLAPNYASWETSEGSVESAEMR